MNRDEPFEQRLRRQSVKPVPPAWRDEILSAAREAGVARHATRNPQPVPWWRELFWPHPTAWAALGCAWLVMLGAQLVTYDDSPQSFARHAPPSRQMRELLRQQEQLFAELVGPKENREADRPKLMAPQPRSSRREEALRA